MFFGYLRVNDSSGKFFLLNTFMERAKELQLDLSDCRGQSYYNGANMQKKRSRVLARILEMNHKFVLVSCAYFKRGCGWQWLAIHLCLDIFWSINKVLCIVFFQRWVILKQQIKLSFKSQSDVRSESRIKATSLHCERCFVGITRTWRLLSLMARVRRLQGFVLFCFLTTAR